MVTATLTARERKSAPFYVWMSIACLVIAVGGFLPTYWLQLPGGTFIGPPLLHLHAALFTAWILLLLSQTVLAAQGRLRNHRAWGLAGIAMASAMVVIGVAAGIYTLRQGLAAGYGDRSSAFFIVPVSSIAVFAGFFIAAIATISRPQAHKRLMMLATIALLPAALARIFFTLMVGFGPGMRPALSPPAPVIFVLAPTLLVELLIVAGVIYDWRSRGKPHPVWLAGAAIITGVNILIVPFSATPAWLGFAHAMAHFAG
jgi:hypothetical protein